MVHAYHYGPYGAYKIRNSDKTYVFPVVVLYIVYVKRINIPEEEWAAELLPLLNDAAFRVVLQLGLESFTDYGAITASLKQQFSLKGNELEWQHKLQTRRQ